MADPSVVLPDRYTCSGYIASVNEPVLPRSSSPAPLATVSHSQCPSSRVWRRRHRACSLLISPSLDSATLRQHPPLRIRQDITRIVKFSHESVKMQVDDTHQQQMCAIARTYYNNFVKIILKNHRNFQGRNKRLPTITVHLAFPLSLFPTPILGLCLQRCLFLPEILQVALGILGTRRQDGSFSRLARHSLRQNMVALHATPVSATNCVTLGYLGVLGRFAVVHISVNSLGRVPTFEMLC